MRVVVHDVGGSLAPCLAPERGWHGGPLCRAVKAGAANARCMAWEIDRLRPMVADFPEGRIQVCHAGLVELALPLTRADRLEAVLFAGQRRPGDGLDALADRPSGWRWPRRTQLPAALGAIEAAHLLEGLRQLGARLLRWIEVHGRLAAAARGAIGDRRLAIRGFIARRHREPIGLVDLARELGLGVDRTAHLVPELLGRGFVELVTEARLQTACALLRHAGQDVPTIARLSGFGDAGHFHRVFRRRFGTTPGRFRARLGGS